MVGRETHGTRFPHGPLDGSPCGGFDPPTVSCAVSPGLPAGLVAAAGLQPAEAPSPGEAEEATGHRSVGRGRLAAHSKKAADTKAHLVLIDETGLFLNPLVKRSWSKIGQTPVIDADGGHRDKVSVIAGVSVSPTSQRLGLYFATEPDGFYTTDKVIEFLRDLLKHLRGKVVVVWDRGNNHKGPLMRTFLSRNRRLTLEMLPPWAPELNPVEPIWSWLKYGELANFVPDDTNVLDDEVVDRLIELKFDPELLRALWERSDLPFPR